MDDEHMSSDAVGLNRRIDNLEHTVTNFITDAFPKAMRDFVDRSEQRALEDRRDLHARLDTIQAAQQRKPSEVFNTLTVIGVALGIGITVLGSIGKLALDNTTQSITEIHNAVTAVESRAEKQVERTEALITKLADRDDTRFGRLYDNTVPGNEVRLRFDVNRKDIDKLDRDKLETAVFTEYARKVDAQLLSLVETLRRTVDKNTDAFNEVRGRYATREESSTQWSQIGQRMTEVQAQINNLRHDFGADYTIGDQVKSLQSRFDQIQSTISQFAAGQAGPPPTPAGGPK